MSTKTFGNYGEDLAVEHLQLNGYKIIERNFRVPWGEIDVIAQEEKTLAFIEVKTRKSLHYGAPFESVEAIKRRKIVKVALAYLKKKYNSVDIRSRFDVVSIVQTPEGKNEIEIIKNAFEAR